MRTNQQASERARTANACVRARTARSQLRNRVAADWRCRPTGRPDGRQLFPTLASLLWFCLFTRRPWQQKSSLGVGVARYATTRSLQRTVRVGVCSIASSLGEFFGQVRWTYAAAAVAAAATMTRTATVPHSGDQARRNLLLLLSTLLLFGTNTSNSNDDDRQRRRQRRQRRVQLARPAGQGIAPRRAAYRHTATDLLGVL